MKRICLLFLFLAFAAVGCAHNSPISVTSGIVNTGPEMPPAAKLSDTSVAAPDIYTVSEKGEIDAQEPPATGTKPELPAQAAEENGDDEYDNEEGASLEEGEEKQATPISDPIEKFNRAMFTFNDRLYYWVLKPVAQGYAKVVPEAPRVSVNNFFNNLGFPVRFVSMLLQANFSGAASELGRFTVNTVWGIGGLMDPASTKQLDIPKKDADLGETLGLYGVGQGFYIVWPFLGPSSARDSINVAGDYFLHPSYLLLWYEWLPVRTYGVVNDTSLRIGDYEALTEAAIDPYIAMRDAYAQYRQKKIEAARGKTEPPRPAGVRVGQFGYPGPDGISDRAPYFTVMQSLNIIESQVNENEHK